MTRTTPQDRQAFAQNLEIILQERKKQAESDQSTNVFGWQQKRQLRRLSTDSLAKILYNGMPSQTQAVLGSGAISLDLMQQIPRPTPEMLSMDSYIVYVGFLLLANGDQVPCVGSGTSESGGAVRICTYENILLVAAAGFRKGAADSTAFTRLLLQKGTQCHMRVVWAMDRTKCFDGKLDALFVEACLVDMLATIPLDYVPKDDRFATASGQTAYLQVQDKLALLGQRSSSGLRGVNFVSPWKQGPSTVRVPDAENVCVVDQQPITQWRQISSLPGYDGFICNNHGCLWRLFLKALGKTPADSMREEADEFVQSGGSSRGLADNIKGGSDGTGNGGGYCKYSKAADKEKVCATGEGCSAESVYRHASILGPDEEKPFLCGTHFARWAGLAKALKDAGRPATAETYRKWEAAGHPYVLKRLGTKGERVLKAGW